LICDSTFETYEITNFPLLVGGERRIPLLTPMQILILINLKITPLI